MKDLDIVVPARNEEWLKHTVEDICAHKRGNTGVIVVLDGDWPVQGGELNQHPDVQVIYLPQSIGQRAATNLGARVSEAEWLMKADAHCAFAEGFDVTLMESAKELGPHVTQIPALRNLHVYNQVCQQCGRSVDQAPKLAACTACGCSDLRHVPVWKPRDRPKTTNWVFDANLHFQYASDKQQQGDHPEVMSFLGAYFFVNRSCFLELGGFDESVGSWGQYGQEWACKAWLSGGRVVCNRKTWVAHFFRVGGIGFPYPIKHGEQERAREYSRTYWRANAWPGQQKPLRWLVDKFWPVPGWTEAERDALPDDSHRGTVEPVVPRPDETGVRGRLRSVHRGVRASGGIVYYSDGSIDLRLAGVVRESVERSGLPVVAVTLKPIEWPAVYPILFQDAERGYLTMFRQILRGLEFLGTEYTFFAEHDVIYCPEHWEFVPPRDDCYFYNLSWLKVDWQTGRAVSYVAKQTSQLCANRELLIEHYRKRIARVERDGFSRAMGFEPGSHNRPERVDDVPSDVWRSTGVNYDIRHGKNLTPSRWRRDQFRNQQHCEGWTESHVNLEEIFGVQQAIA